MAIKIDTEERDLIANAIAGGWNGGATTLYFYDALPPASPNSAYVGNALCSIVLPTTAFGASSTGVISKAGTWSGTVGVSGTTIGFRMINSSTNYRMDGTVGLGTGDISLDQNVLVSGGTLTMSTFTITQPINA